MRFVGLAVLSAALLAAPASAATISEAQAAVDQAQAAKADADAARPLCMDDDLRDVGDIYRDFHGQPNLTEAQELLGQAMVTQDPVARAGICSEAILTATDALDGFFTAATFYYAGAGF